MNSTRQEKKMRVGEKKLEREKEGPLPHGDEASQLLKVWRLS